MRCSLLLGLGWLFNACTIGISSDQSGTSLSLPCASNSDCPASMTCASNQCRASNPNIRHVLVDVSLPASTNIAQYSGLGFVLPIDVPMSGRLDITLPAVAPLTLAATFQNIPDKGYGCAYTQDAASKQTIIAVATHRWPVDGLEQTVFTVNNLPATMPALPTNCDYEVYFALSNEFQSSLGPQCNLAPVLVRDVKVNADRSLSLSWPAPNSLSLDVQIQASATAPGSDLAGWQLDVVDPIQGRTLAIPVQLGPGAIDPVDTSLVHFKTAVTYNTIASADSSPPIGTEIVRLQPPTGDQRPTYYVSLASQSLFGSAGEAAIPIGVVPTAVTVSGLVETQDSSQPVQAQIAFLSQKFDVGNSGIWAEYRTSTQSDSSGQFQVSLPAGQYRVLVVPPGDVQYALLDTAWTVQAAPANQAGRLLSLPPLSHVRGSIDGLLQLAASQSATVQATPSNGLLFDKPTGIVALRNDNPGARTASILLQPNSIPEFSLPTDNGLFDLSLRPPDGLPWLVSPRLQVQSGENPLNGWSMPGPVQWPGNLRIPSNVAGDNSISKDIPRAVLRVYALLDEFRAVVSEPKDASSIVQIAETRTDANGSFQLVLPDRIQPQ